MRIGFIGYGSMAKMLIHGLLARKAVAPENITVASRSKEKLVALADLYPKIQIAQYNGEVARTSDLLFLCVKPLEMKGLIESIREELDHHQPHIVSIAACVTLDYLRQIHLGRYTKVIPSLTSEVGCGISLLVHGAEVGTCEAIELERLLANLGVVKVIPEEDFEAASDLTSCAPGLIAEMFHQFAAAGARHSHLSQSDAEEMVISTLYGTAKLLFEGKMLLSEMKARVATKGGITEEGVKQLDLGLPAVFDAVFYATLAKHQHVKKLLSDQI